MKPILNTKKELTIKDSKLFEIIKSLNTIDWYSLVKVVGYNEFAKDAKIL